MEGIVKKFFKDKGYGFIKGSDQKEYFFHVDDLNSPNPQSGDAVNFTPKSSFKGLRAESVEIKKGKDKPASNSSPNNNGSDKVNCPNCGKVVIPRMIINKGQPSRTVCNHCGGTIKKFYHDVAVQIAMFIFVGFIMLIMFSNAQ